MYDVQYSYWIKTERKHVLGRKEFLLTIPYKYSTSTTNMNIAEREKRGHKLGWKKVRRQSIINRRESNHWFDTNVCMSLIYLCRNLHLAETPITLPGNGGDLGAPRPIRALIRWEVLHQWLRHFTDLIFGYSFYFWNFLFSNNTVVNLLNRPAIAQELWHVWQSGSLRQITYKRGTDL